MRRRRGYEGVRGEVRRRSRYEGAGGEVKRRRGYEDGLCVMRPCVCQWRACRDLPQSAMRMLYIM